ncbi:MAG: hypothetical protein CME62_07395 [Halobacteriovoraceae bacterium]|nr:hypothetical protein [Halobacteriovoraceae bacterium]|tara:strand:+ start:34275 stop:34922 length:648 start_codon:yes stop_codon:yes gene_type:complete
MKKEAEIINLAEHIQNNMPIESGNFDQSTRLSLTPEANLSSRIWAFGIDLMFVFFLNYCVYSAYAVGLEFLFPTLSNAAKLELLGGSLGLNIGVFMVSFWTYFFYSTFVMSGKTLGKKIFGLSIISEDFVLNHQEMTYKLSLKQCAQRATGYLVCYFSFGTFFVFNFASEDKRGLSDYLSGTRTVDDQWLHSTLEHRRYSAEVIRIDVRSLDKVA